MLNTTSTADRSGICAAGPTTVKAEVDEELRLHLEMRVEELRSRGTVDRRGAP